MGKFFKPVPKLLFALGAAVVAFVATLAVSINASQEPKAAWAAAHIFINDGNVPTTAEDFQHECDPNQGGGPLPGQDVWVFVLPGNHATTGDFVNITAHFLEGDVTITAVDDPGNFDNGGPSTSKGWIVTPEGWTLVNAEADITGTADFFNLTHTCPASSPSPSPSASMSTSPSPSMSTSPSPSASMSRSPSASPSMSKSPSASPSMSRTPSPSPSVSKSPSASPSQSKSPRPSPSRTSPGYHPYHPSHPVLQVYQGH